MLPMIPHADIRAHRIIYCTQFMWPKRIVL